MNDIKGGEYFEYQKHVYGVCVSRGESSDRIQYLKPSEPIGKAGMIISGYLLVLVAEKSVIKSRLLALKKNFGAHAIL